MPTFQGQVTEEQLSQLIAYVRSLGGTGERRGRRHGGRHPARQSRRIGPIGRIEIGRNRDHGTTAVATPPPCPAVAGDRLREAQLPQRRLRPEVVAPDQGPQADRHPLPDLGHGLLRPRRPVRPADPPRAADARGRPDAAGHLQPDVHHARRHHGVLLPDPVDPGGARQLPRAADDRGQGPRLPAAQPGELVRLQPGRHLHPLGDRPRRRRHRLDLLHAAIAPTTRTPT